MVRIVVYPALAFRRLGVNVELFADEALDTSSIIEVERNENGGEWIPLKCLEHPLLSFVDYRVMYGARYRYRARVVGEEEWNVGKKVLIERFKLTNLTSKLYPLYQKDEIESVNNIIDYTSLGRIKSDAIITAEPVYLSYRNLVAVYDDWAVLEDNVSISADSIYLHYRDLVAKYNDWDTEEDSINVSVDSTYLYYTDLAIHYDDWQADEDSLDVTVDAIYLYYENP